MICQIPRPFPVCTMRRSISLYLGKNVSSGKSVVSPSVRSTHPVIVCPFPRVIHAHILCVTDGRFNFLSLFRFSGTLTGTFAGRTGETRRDGLAGTYGTPVTRGTLVVLVLMALCTISGPSGSFRLLCRLRNVSL